MADSVAQFDSTGDSLRTLTYSSVPLAALDAPEPSGVKGEFVYKFFTATEREEYSGGTGTVQIRQSTSATGATSATRAATTTGLPEGTRPESMPRWIRISFTQPQSEKEATTQAEVSDFLGRNFSLIDLINNRFLHIEDSVSSERFQRAQITSADLDLKAVSFLKAIEDDEEQSASLNEVSNRISLALAGTRGEAPTDLAAQASQAENDAAIGRVIVDYINASGQAQSKINYYSRESRADVERTASVVTSRQETLAINRLVFEDVISASTCNVNNLLNDEIRDLLASSVRVQNEARQTSKSAGISASANEIIVKPFSSAQASGFSVYRSIHVGYLVEKLEIKSGNIVEHPSYLLTGSRQTSMIDDRVNYGSMYKYRIRSIFIREMPVTFERTGRSGIAKTLVASSGESAECFVPAIEEIPPPEVNDFLITYDYETSGNRLSWSLPVNPQKDIKYFQVFRRMTTNVPYRLIRVIDFDDSTIREPSRESYSSSVVERAQIVKSVFVDTDVEKDKEYMYAVCCVDAHGLTSGYSMQIAAIFSRAKNRVITRHISRAGAPKTYPNLYLEEDTFSDVVRIKGASRLHTLFDPETLSVVHPSGAQEDLTGETIFTVSIINETDCKGSSIEIKSAAIVNAADSQKVPVMDPDEIASERVEIDAERFYSVLD